MNINDINEIKQYSLPICIGQPLLDPLENLLIPIHLIWHIQKKREQEKGEEQEK